MSNDSNRRQDPRTDPRYSVQNLLKQRAERHAWPNLTLGAGPSAEDLVCTSGQHLTGRRNLAQAAEDREDGLSPAESGFTSRPLEADGKPLVLVAEGVVESALLDEVAQRIERILAR